MIKNKILSTLLKELKQDFKKAVGLRYPNKEGNGELYGYAMAWFHDIMDDELTPMACETTFKKLQRWYLDNTHYQILEHNDIPLAVKYFGYSSAYAYLALYSGEIHNECPEALGESYYLMDEATAHMSQSLLCGWESEYAQIGDSLIASIDFGQQKDAEGQSISKIISTGTEDMLPGWFLLDLYCKVYDKSYDKSLARYPENMLIYDNILEQWDTQDTTEVDRMIYLMGEYHLEETREAKNDEEYFMFDDSLYWLFPYEILIWLKLREIRGLANPSQFSHPLMHTPIARFYLTLDTPLERPSDLPYAYELLEKLQTLCPKTEIPNWLKPLGTTENKSSQTPPTDATHAPTTGNYQAHLPEGHPDSDKLKANPFAYNRYNKGEPFSYEGLEEYDSALIEWRLREE